MKKINLKICTEPAFNQFHDQVGTWYSIRDNNGLLYGLYKQEDNNKVITHSHVIDSEEIKYYFNELIKLHKTGQDPLEVSLTPEKIDVINNRKPLDFTIQNSSDNSLMMF